MSNNVYVKCDRSVKVNNPEVYMKDFARIRCSDSIIQAKANCIKVHQFGKDDPKRAVISCIKIVELIEEKCGNVTVDVLGETDVLLEWDRKKEPKWLEWIKVVLVSLVCFFGTAFTIMAYHQDVGINDIFTKMYYLVMQEETKGINPMEVAYSIGLAVGIIVFFNHVGGRRITNDPTPIEVAMRKYENDVDMTLIETGNRMESKKGRQE